MEQVVLITAYKEFDYLIQFVTALSDSGVISYVHIDKKTATPEILQRINSIKYATAISEYSIPWGGSSMY